MQNERENFEELLAQHEAQSSRVEVGRKISGKIIAISGDSVFLDVGLKEDGVMDAKEILDVDGQATAAPGDEIEAFVVGMGSQGIRLARSMGGAGIGALEAARDAEIPVDGRVKAVCKGGYQVEVLRKIAFCPGSQMDSAPGEEPESLIGREMRFLIIRIENHGRNIVVSSRALAERERRENLDKLFSALNIGDIVEGKVSRLASFGAFVELAPSVEGMVHLSEISWSRPGSAEEVLSPGDSVRAKLLSISKDDKGRERISLSIKQAQGDPWEDVESKFHVGDIVDGKVRRLAPFGAFVEIAPGLDGLVHISEMSWEKRINKPEDVLAPGENVQVKIREISPESKRISLSLKDALGDPWQEAGSGFQPGARVSGTVESKSQYGLFITLAPGITGLLPQSAIKNSRDANRLSKLNKGDAVDLVIEKVDAASHRISLAPENGGEEEQEAQKSWREHAIKVQRENSGMGLMAQALQKAMIKKEKGVKKA